MEHIAFPTVDQWIDDASGAEAIANTLTWLIILRLSYDRS